MKVALRSQRCGKRDPREPIWLAPTACKIQRHSGDWQTSATLRSRRRLPFQVHENDELETQLLTQNQIQTEPTPLSDLRRTNRELAQVCGRLCVYCLMISAAVSRTLPRFPCPPPALGAGGSGGLAPVSVGFGRLTAGADTDFDVEGAS